MCIRRSPGLEPDELPLRRYRDCSLAFFCHLFGAWLITLLWLGFVRTNFRAASAASYQSVKNWDQWGFSERRRVRPGIVLITCPELLRSSFAHTAWIGERPDATAWICLSRRIAGGKSPAKRLIEIPARLFQGAIHGLLGRCFSCFAHEHTRSYDACHRQTDIGSTSICFKTWKLTRAHWWVVCPVE